MAVITTSIKTIDRQIRKLDRLRRTLLIVAWAALAAGVFDVLDASSTDSWKYPAGVVAIVSGLAASWQAHRCREGAAELERHRRILLRHISNGGRQL